MSGAYREDWRACTGPSLDCLNTAALSPPPLSQLLLCSGGKKRAPRALREVKAFVQQQMGTADVRVDTTLNKFLWSRGINHVPFRVRVRCDRKRNEDEESTERLFTLVSYVPKDDFKGKFSLPPLFLSSGLARVASTIVGIPHSRLSARTGPLSPSLPQASRPRTSRALRARALKWK